MCPFSRFLLMPCFRPGFSLQPLLSHLTLIGLFVAPLPPCLVLRWRRRWLRREGGQIVSTGHWAQEGMHRCLPTVPAEWPGQHTHWPFEGIRSFHLGTAPVVTEDHHYLQLKRKRAWAQWPQRLFLGVVSLGNVEVPPPLRPTASETGGGSPHTTHLCLSKPYRSFRCYSRVWDLWITVNCHLWINV